MLYLAVFCGGALGSLSRELVIEAQPQIWLLSSSFAVNVLACFILGWLIAMRHRLHTHIMHFGAVGLCGGLSTFSTFAADVFTYLIGGELAMAIASSGVEILAGLCAVIIGGWASRAVDAYHGDLS